MKNNKDGQESSQSERSVDATLLDPNVVELEVGKLVRFYSDQIIKCECSKKKSKTRNPVNQEIGIQIIEGCSGIL